MPMIATLGEGNTPLVESHRLAQMLGLRRLLLKLETCNPSGSYKDRFAAAQVTEMLRDGARACVATSSGNTGSALAAYCARYGIACAVLVNEHAPAGKLTQMQAHGARIYRVKDFATSAAVTESVFARLVAFSNQHGVPLAVSAYRYCPAGMEGVEPIAQELWAQSGQRLDHVFVPVGGGGLFSAVCRGFGKIQAGGVKIHAVQPEGCSTVVAAYERGVDEIEPVESTTRISGLSVPNDIDASLALRNLRECGGMGIAVSDDEVFESQRMLLSLEGIYCEPAGATALAGLRKALRLGRVSAGDTMVCLVTGHGFKDPDSVAKAAEGNPAEAISHTGVEKALLELMETR
jgi:threonine synthase